MAVAPPARMPGSEIHYDPAIYERELKTIFGRAWLFVGHESMVPEPGDFVGNYQRMRDVLHTVPISRGR